MMRMNRFVSSIALALGTMFDASARDIEVRRIDGYPASHDTETFVPQPGNQKTGHKLHRRSQSKRRKLARIQHGHQGFSARLRGR